MKYLTVVLAVALALMAGCASQPDYEQWRIAAVEQQKTAATAAASCKTDLCVYLVMEKAGEHALRVPRQQIHPGWEYAFRSLELVATLGLPAYFNRENSKVWAGMATGLADSFGNMDRSYTDNSVSIGRDQIGGNQDRSDSSIGRDNIGGDQHVGDQYADSCVGDACLNASPADYSDRSQTDNSDNSDSSDNSDNRYWEAAEPEVVQVE